ncbi:hypothetical protein [Nocardiopsis sp. LOL_012]|uniref:hypothetical protein n=1 Tax=Nocardiopsis sp. LOL_012 TaxID=3345409 RepID=UPI003A8A2456
MALLFIAGAVGTGDWYVSAWAVLFLLVYEHLLRPVPCSAPTRRDRPCRRNTRGRWRGCHHEQHQRAKWAAVRAALFRRAARTEQGGVPAVRPIPEVGGIAISSTLYTRAVVGTALFSLLAAVAGSLWAAG